MNNFILKIAKESKDFIEYQNYFKSIKLQESINLNGHKFKNLKNSDIIDCLVMRLSFYNKTPLKEFLSYPYYNFKLKDFVCSNCLSEIKLKFKDNKISFSKCLFPEGIKSFKFYLNIPSGKMCIGNDFRSIFPISDEYNISSKEEEYKLVQKYASIGLAHAYVGNTCPTLWKKSDEEFYIGNKSGNKNPLPNLRKVESIITDLWWFSICDSSLMPEYYKSNCKITSCSPGYYQFEHFYGIVKEKNNIYTSIKKIAEPKKEVIYNDFYDLNYTAEQVVASYINEWEYGVFSEKNIVRAIDHILFTCGNGLNYHPNGWVGYFGIDENDDIKEIKIPILNKKYNWYPFDDSSYIMKLAGLGRNFDSPNLQELKFNKSFRELAFNCCQCIIRYGITDWNGNENRIKENINQIFKQLILKYPNEIPDYCKDLI